MDITLLNDRFYTDLITKSDGRLDLETLETRVEMTCAAYCSPETCTYDGGTVCGDNCKAYW